MMLGPIDVVAPYRDLPGRRRLKVVLTSWVSGMRSAKRRPSVLANSGASSAAGGHSAGSSEGRDGHTRRSQQRRDGACENAYGAGSYGRR